MSNAVWCENIQRGTFQDGFCSLTKAVKTKKTSKKPNLMFLRALSVLILYDGFITEGHCDWNR